MNRLQKNYALSPQANSVHVLLRVMDGTVLFAFILTACVRVCVRVCTHFLVAPGSPTHFTTSDAWPVYM